MKLSIRINILLIGFILGIIFYMISEGDTYRTNTQDLKKNIIGNKELVQNIQESGKNVRIWKEQENLSSYVLANKQVEQIIKENQQKAEDLKKQYESKVTELTTEYTLMKQDYDKQIEELNGKKLMGTVEVIDMNDKIKKSADALKKVNDDILDLKIQKIKLLNQNDEYVKSLTFNVNDVKKEMLVIRDKQGGLDNIIYMKDTYPFNDGILRVFSPLCDTMRMDESTKTVYCNVGNVTKNKINYFKSIYFQ